MKVLSLCFLLLCGLSALGQRLLLMGADTTYLDQVGWVSFAGQGEISSSALTNQFMGKLAFGGFIGDPTKKEVAEHLEEQNRLGATLDLGIQYRSFGDTLFGLSDWGLDLALENHSHGAALFAENTFDVLFNGNAAYAGERLELDRNAVRLMQFQKLGFGLFHRKHFSGLRLSVVNGQFLQDALVDEAYLYTSALGDTVALTYQGTYIQSDPDHLTLGSGNGIGLALDAVFNVPFEDGGGYFSLALNNLGHVWWSEATKTYSADTSFTWIGVNFNDVSTLNNIGLPNFSDTLHYTQETGRRQTWLPASVRASVMRSWSDQAFWEAAITVRPDGIHLPLVEVGYGYMPNNSTLWRFTGRAGGYGMPGLGLALEKRMGATYLEVGVPDMPALVLNTLHGVGAYLRIGWFLKPQQP